MNDYQLRKYVETNLDRLFPQKQEVPIYEEWFEIIDEWDDNWDDDDGWVEE